MTLLLDTHALIWWFQGSEKLGLNAKQRIAAGTEPILVSVVSIFEITTKVRIGKLPGVEELHGNFAGYLRQQAFQLLSLTLEHAERAGTMPIPHRDPFDRLLIAQAQIEQAYLVSNETLFDHFGVLRLW